MQNKIVKIVFAVLTAAFFVATTSYVAKEKVKVRCSTIEVQILDSLDNHIIDKKEIINIVRSIKPSVLGQRLDSILLKNIEERIIQHPSIRDAQVYKTLGRGNKGGGKIMVRVLQHEPILRIMTPAAQYFLNRYGSSMPVSISYAAHVPVVNGHVKKGEMDEALYELGLFIYDDPFWKAQVEQLYVNSKNEIILVPRVGDHIIELGTIDGFQKKFRNLMALYQKGFKKEGWNSYKKISLKYNNQIVCTKK